MGAYVNPPKLHKKQWLEKYGDRLTDPPKIEDFDGLASVGKLPVCLVDNGPFMAGGIAFSKQELRVFKRPDGRPKIWYIVDEDKLHEVSPELERYQEAL